MNDYFETEGLARLRRATRRYGRVVRIFMIEGASDELESELREVLQAFSGAMNYLEYTEWLELAHERLDAAGKLAREEFTQGCHLAYRDGAYYQECPAALAHNRVGLSPGVRIDRLECSICGQDPDDCVHIKGRVYDGQACTHLITAGEILEISFVGRPAQPDARLTSVSLGSKELREHLGPQFEHGMPVLCDRCLSECDGISRPFEEEGEN